MPVELGLALLVSVPLVLFGIKLIRGGKSEEAPEPVVPAGFSQPSGVDLAGGAPPPQPAGPKKRRWGLILGLGIVAFVGQLFGCGVALMRAERAWQAELPNTGKAPTREVPPGQTNAADIYLDAAKPIPSQYPAENSKLREIADKPWSDPDSSLAKQLDDLEPALAAARKAGGLPFCDFLPAEVVRLNVSMKAPQVGRLRSLGLFLLLNSRRNQAAGKHTEALEDVVAALTLARRIQEQKTPHIVFAGVAAVMMDDAFVPAASLLSDPAVPPSVYVGLRDELLHESPVAAALARSWAFHGSLSQEANSLYLDKTLWWLPGAFRRGLIEDYRKAAQEVISLALAAVERNEPELFDQHRAELLSKYPPVKEALHAALGNCIKVRADFGDCWVMRSDPGVADFGGVLARTLLTEAKVQVLFAASGIRLRELQAAAPPATLAELVPEHLPRPAYDPFDGGKPLRLSTNDGGWSVYSLGMDKKDGQGREAPPSSATDDWRKPAEGDVVLTAKRWIPPKAPRKPRRAG